MLTIDPALRERIKNCKSLPTLPGVALELLRQCRDPEASLKEIAVLIGTDPALTAKVLKFVNSPFYYVPREVTTLSHAVGLLGLNSVRTLALSFSLVRGLQIADTNRFDYSLYWKRSILSAAASRTLSVAGRIGDPEELFWPVCCKTSGCWCCSRWCPRSTAGS